MPSSESYEHKKVKTLIEDKLKEWTGASLTEYPSSGHELDVFATTPDGTSIHVEIIWSDSLQNFNRDMILLLTSDANIKIVVANPKLLENDKCKRQFEKIAVSQRKLGFAIHGELINGADILNDSAYLATKFKDVVNDLLSYIQKHGRVVGTQAEFNPPEPKSADRREEQLLSNLFPVVKYPPTIFSAPTGFRKDKEVFKILGQDVEEHAFVLKNKRLYVFDNLRKYSSIFASIIKSDDIREEHTTQWLLDDNKRNDLIRLLNIALRIYCVKKRDLSYDKKHRRFIACLKNGKDNIFRWRAGTKYVSRALAKRSYGKEGNLLYCKHYTISLKFISLDENLFLEISPSMTFTKDGYNPIRLEKLASLMGRYLSKQWNSAHLSQMLFLVKYLSKLDVTLSFMASGQQIQVSTIPKGVPVSVGIVEEDERLRRLKQDSGKK